jgi:hypothetical protein
MTEAVNNLGCFLTIELRKIASKYRVPIYEQGQFWRRAPGGGNEEISESNNQLFQISQIAKEIYPKRKIESEI